MLIEGAAVRTTRVLLVGDGTRAAMSIVEMLRTGWPQGLLVTLAADVRDAAQELAEHGEGCVLVELPDRGPERLAPLRDIVAAAPHAPVVVLSDGLEDEIGTAALRAGAQDHLRAADLTPTSLARTVRFAIERKRHEVRLTQQALEDPLTGLPNRMLFRDRLHVALDRSRRTGLAPALMFLDVDSFKRVNDTLGHAAGDRLLCELATRFVELLRPMDTVARLGGDEFTFLFEGLSGAEEANAIARRIGDAAGAPIALGAPDGDTRMSVSIGIAMLEDPAATFEAVVHEADEAMYRAKRDGGGRAEFRDGPRGADHPAAAEWATPAPGPGPAPAPAPATVGPSPSETSPATVVSLDELALRRALGDGQLRLHYQPRVSINGRTGLVGFEALVRWEHPERGLVAPAEFLPLAERSGLIGEISDWVIDEALAQVRRWRQSRPGVTISVNLSARQLADPMTAHRLGERIARAGADPSVLWLEVPGPAALQDIDATARALAGLREVGVGIALDDFGRGGSSLESLRGLPLDMLKIDRSVIAGLGDGEEDDAHVGAVVEVCHALGLGVVAEGVETDLQLVALRDLRCDGAQGFLFSQPVPADSVGELLGAH